MKRQMMCDEKLIEKDVEGSGFSLIWGSLRFQYLSVRKPRKSFVRRIKNGIAQLA
jgi:hypothetical protein